MGYFTELPNIAYQSPLSHKNSSRDYIIIKNIFRRSKLLDYLGENVSLFNKYVIGDGARPDISCRLGGAKQINRPAHD